MARNWRWVTNSPPVSAAARSILLLDRCQGRDSPEIAVESPETWSSCLETAGLTLGRGHGYERGIERLSIDSAKDRPLGSPAPSPAFSTSPRGSLPCPTISLLFPCASPHARARAIWSEADWRYPVRMVFVDRMPAAAVSRSLRMRRRCVERFMAYYRQTGGFLDNDPERWNRHRDNYLDDDDFRDVVLAVVAAEPEIFLDEAEVAVAQVVAHVDGGVGISGTSIRRILAYNFYTRKVIKKTFISRNEEQRAAWVETQWRTPLRFRVCLDEANRVGRSPQRRWA